MTNKINENERRRYFRVTDLVGLKCHFLNEGERDLAVQSQPTSLKGLLGQIEEQISTSMSLIENPHPEIHQILDLFNQKINLAFGHGYASGEDDFEDATQACKVNLSACGIAFPSEESALLNQYISMELTLYPRNVRLNLLLAVISCDDFEGDSSDAPYLIRADFVNVSDVDQESLVQHVIKRQVQQIKEERNESLVVK